MFRSLTGNEFVCNCHTVEFVHKFRANGSHLFDSVICHEPKQLRGRAITSLQKDDLVCTEAIKDVCVEDGYYCPSGCSCHETIVRCSNKNFKEFPVGISIRTTELFLDSNDITYISHELNKLKNLIKLDLSHNRIASIEKGAFRNLTKLSTLILSYNKLQCLEEGAFSNLTNLRILSLHGNDISVLPESAFVNLHNITHIALGSNSLYCDCRIAWFSRWIKSRFIEAGIARCELPLHFRNQLLLSANERQFKCDEKVPKNVIAKCDACVENPCKNSGICERTHGKKFTCKCAPSFHGKYCENKIDACYGEPCLNGGTCKILQDGRFKCHCVKGFEGDRCQKNIDDCAHNKCQNNAICIDLINSYECKCPPMHIGRFCEEKVEYCSKKMNPCANGGICVRHAQSYKCNCSPGFTGSNCTINIDDCKNNLCKNNALCIDGIQSYQCECVNGYTGKFCELPSISADHYPNTSPCHAHSCDHGICHELDDDIVCECTEGYTGKHCDELRAVGFVLDDSYIALEPLITFPEGNLTFTLITTASTGVILYHGDDAHLSIELYDGRLKISFCVGNLPSSHMYSYNTVHDGYPHRIQIYIKGKALTLKIDNYDSQTVVNSGPKEMFTLATKHFLYFGGIPTSIASKAIAAFHLKHTHSLKGCLSDLHINKVAVDFQKAEKLEKILHGCAKSVDLCKGVECNSGNCITNTSLSTGFTCHCPSGYSGKYCEKREIFCTKETFREHYEVDGCRSVEQIKNARCHGWCGHDNKQCCMVVKSKRRRLKMHCKNGSTISRIVHIVRKCQCIIDAVCSST
ncbi:unnamed protein product [Thelazia callipaeda]|uniref:EGF-like domain-containing protein n=1 Tax=Thelazia callipaeda TaxID=103827 RepID=A0A0N5D1U2_THECL|nr:unnamed protein product [Thelazia callipaeda]